MGVSVCSHTIAELLVVAGTTHFREAGSLIVDNTLEDSPGMQINRAIAG
jgi:hypothetical protein